MTPTSLEHARALPPPARESTLRRSVAVSDYWKQNAETFREAWAEWEESEREHLPQLDESLIDPSLRAAVDSAWKDPESDDAVRRLWEEVGPGIYQCQFFDVERLATLRTYLDAIADAGIPLRPPYGIVLNRRGAMLDPRSVGYLAAPRFQAFYRSIVNRYFRPISRLLFPETLGFDGQTFGFSITYQPSEDTSIRPHTDASTTTLNLNLNLPGESFGGSAVDFYNPNTGQPDSFVFAPGVAVLHRGTVPHAARPITEGQRTNFVLWLYGEHGQIPPRGVKRPPVEPEQRWALSQATPDGYAPF